MSPTESEQAAPNPQEPNSRLPDWAVALLAVEAVCLLIGLAMPITPSRTGSTWSPAELFAEDPSYLAEAAFWFVATHVLILALGLVAWVYARLTRSG
jgi:hypothetical protein